jgi:hypothetical protein
MNLRGRVVEAGRPTTVKGAIFAEFARAVEAGDSHGLQRLVDEVTPETPRRPERDPRPATGGAD